MGWKIFAIVQDPTGILWNLNQFWAQLFEGQLALNLGLKLTLISFSCVQKHFLGEFSLLFLELPIINLQTKRIKTEIFFKLSNLNSNLALTLGCLNPASNNSALENILQYYRQDHVKSQRILQYPRVSYPVSRILWDRYENQTSMKGVQRTMENFKQWNHTRSQRFSQDGIENPITSLLTFGQDTMKFQTRFCTTQQHPVNLAYRILKKSGKDSTVLQTRSYETLQYPRESYKIVQDSMEQVWDPIENLITSLLTFSQDTMVSQTRF